MLDEAATRRKPRCCRRVDSRCDLASHPRDVHDECDGTARWKRCPLSQRRILTRTTNYELHQKHLKLKGLQPKTIDAYSRAIRRVGDYFAHQIDDLSEADLLDYLAQWERSSNLRPYKHLLFLIRPILTNGALPP